MAKWCIYASVDWIIIGSDNGLSLIKHQAIIWTNYDILQIRPKATRFNEILFGIQKFSFKTMHFNISSAKWWPFCFGLNVLKDDESNAAKISLELNGI